MSVCKGEGREEAVAVFILNGCLKCNAAGAGWDGETGRTVAYAGDGQMVQIE